MNLQSIQKRVEELSAELLTISNDLAFMLNGEVTRPTQEQLKPLRRFQELNVGDNIEFSAEFKDICGDRHLAGIYEVVNVEKDTYLGDFSVAVSLGEVGIYWWINFNKIASTISTFKVGK